MKTITIKGLGVVTKEENVFDDWKSQPVGVNLFEGKELVFYIKNKEEIDDQQLGKIEIAVNNFLSLNPSVKDELSTLLLKNYQNRLNTFDIDSLEIGEESEIWKYVLPKEIIVSQRKKNDMDIYVQIICDCDWEMEHGLQLVFRNGQKITRVSACDGHLTEAEARGIPDSEDILLSNY